MIELSYIIKDVDHKCLKESFIVGQLIGEDNNYYYVKNNKGEKRLVDKKLLTYMRIRQEEDNT